MESDDNVINELFGDTPLYILSEALDLEFEDLIWHLKRPLGEATFRKIRREKKASELIFLINTRSADSSLTDPFRDYVLSSASLRYLLTPGAKAMADRMKPPEKKTPEGRHTPLMTPRDQRAMLQASFYDRPFNIELEDSGVDEIAASIIASDKDVYTLLIQDMAKQWVDVELQSEFTVQSLGRVQSTILTNLSKVLSAEMADIENAVGIQLQRYARMDELRNRADKEVERERSKKFSVAFCGLAKAGCV
jgi:hypothetical protein